MKLRQEIAKYWVGGPNMPPRKSQIEALNWAVENKDKKYLILEAPVGSGKSLVGLTISRFLNNRSFVLTPQTILQKQYENDFNSNREVDLASFYGKANYKCTKKEGLSCATGSVLKPRCKNCPYNNARDRAKNSSNTVMNYALGLGIWHHTKVFKHEDRPLVRNLAILDEAHTAEKHLTNFDSLKIVEKWCEDRNISIPKDPTLKDAIAFIANEYFMVIVEAFELLVEELDMIKDKKGNDAKITKKSNQLKALESSINVCDSLLSMDMQDIEDQYVLITDKFGIELKRLYGRHSFRHIMEPYAKKFLFMSSTILGKDEYCNELGIKPEDAAFISIDSEFDPENRPVIYLPQMKMNYKWKDNENELGRNKLLATIKKIAIMFEGENGIIHTGNFAIAEWLTENLDIQQTHQIIHHNPGGQLNRNEAIAEFMDESTTPAILISPSSTEGLDLKYDLGRFAIFAKVPYGNMGDEWIKRRMKISNAWYQRQALIDIIQGAGRIVRTPDDEGTTFILDESFRFLLQQNRDIVPQWWLDGYKEM